MNAEIKKETDKGFGVTVYDNNNIKHKIGVLYDGQINGHLQDRYPDDPSKRTPEGNEHVEQARRYAKWHVYRERGYDTLAPYENPDHIVAVMIALVSLSDEEITTMFGQLRSQLRSHHDDGPVDLPFEDTHPQDLFVYRQDVYVSPDPAEQSPPMVEQYCAYLADQHEVVLEALADQSDESAAVSELVTGTEELWASLPSFEIEAVSDLHYLHSDGRTEQTHWAASPREREPDARLELLPIDVDVFDSYRVFLVSHLTNQIRDLYLLMGCEPPEPFQVQGFGTYEGMKRQQLIDLYDPYFQASDPVDSWTPAGE